MFGLTLVSLAALWPCQAHAGVRRADPNIDATAVMSTGDWAASLAADPAMDRLSISSSTQSLVFGDDIQPATNSPLLKSDPSNIVAAKLPGTQDVPAAIPLEPAAPMGILTLVLLAIPLVANRRLRRWLLR